MIYEQHRATVDYNRDSPWNWAGENYCSPRVDLAKNALIRVAWELFFFKIHIRQSSWWRQRNLLMYVSYDGGETGKNNRDIQRQSGGLGFRSIPQCPLTISNADNSGGTLSMGSFSANRLTDRLTDRSKPSRIIESITRAHIHTRITNGELLAQGEVLAIPAWTVSDFVRL